MIDLSRLRLTSLLSRSLLVGLLSAVGIATGVTPHLSSSSPQLVFKSSAYAQAVSREEITNYARSAIAIEQKRLQAFQEVQQLLDPVPSIDCSNTDSVNQLENQQLRSIVVNYCEDSKALVASNGLTIQRFNEITSAIQIDPELEKRVREEFNRLQ